MILPWLGVLIYLIARGGSMQERAMAQAVAQEKAQREYIQQVSASSGGASSASSADELEKLAKLQSQGVITAEEFAAQKAKILA